MVGLLDMIMSTPEAVEEARRVRGTSVTGEPIYGGSELPRGVPISSPVSITQLPEPPGVNVRFPALERERALQEALAGLSGIPRPMIGKAVLGSPPNDALTYSPPFTPAQTIPPVNAAEQALKAGLDGGQAAAVQNVNRQQEGLFGGTVADILSNPFVQGLLERFRDPAFQQPGFAGQGLETLARGFTAADYNVRAAEAAARAKAQEQAVEIQKELLKAQPKPFRYAPESVYKSTLKANTLGGALNKISEMKNIVTQGVGGLAGSVENSMSAIGAAFGLSGQTPSEKYNQIRAFILSGLSAEEAAGGLSKADYETLQKKLPESGLFESNDKLLDALDNVAKFLNEKLTPHAYVLGTEGIRTEGVIPRTQSLISGKRTVQE